MIKRSPSRNSRSKGVKGKHVLQICVLLAVCFWLIYQVKHSHDKKKEFDEKDAKVSVRTQTGNGELKLGRKDPHPRIQDMINNDKVEEDEEEDTGLEELLKEEKEHEERIKQKEDQLEESIEERDGEEERKITEEEEQEEEAKNQDTEDEGHGGGDDELDEHDHDKTAETNHEEDLLDEEKEKEEELEEKEIENSVDEDKGTEMYLETSTDDPEQDEVGENSHEAREELYKADDASSAVAHDAQIIGTELEKETVDNSNENSARNDLEVDNSNGNNSEEYNGNKSKLTLEVGQGQIPERSPSLIVTTKDKTNDVITHTTVEDQSPENATFASLPNNQSVLSIKPSQINAEASNGNNSTGRSVEISESLHSNEKAGVTDSPAENITAYDESTGKITNSQTTESEKIDNSNSDVSDSTVKTQLRTETEVNSGASEKFGTSDGHSDMNDAATLPVVKNESGETDSKNVSGEDNVNKESVETDLTNESGETEEKLDNREEVALTNDPIDSSDIQLAKEARIDLDTLPDTTSTEGVNSRDSAAE